jgi:hypothetical protein
MFIPDQFLSVDSGPVYEFRSGSQIAKMASKQENCENLMLQELAVLCTGWQAFPGAWKAVYKVGTKKFSITCIVYQC